MYFKEIWRLCDAVFWFYVLSWRERCVLWSCYCDGRPLSDIMEVIYLFFLKVCQSSIAKYMVCQYWTSVILINFQLLPYHYDFFCNEQNIQFLYVVIQNLKFSSSNWTQDEKWKYPSPLNRENFLKFQQVGVFFLFLVEKWFWQDVGVTLEAYFQKKELKEIFRHPVLSQQRMDHSLPFSLASSSLPR